MAQDKSEKNNSFSFFTENEQTKSSDSSWLSNRINEFKDLPPLVQESTLIGFIAGGAIGACFAGVGFLIGAPVGIAIGFGVGSLISAALELLEKGMELMKSSLDPDVKPYESHGL